MGAGRGWHLVGQVQSFDGLQRSSWHIHIDDAAGHLLQPRGVRAFQQPKHSLFKFKNVTCLVCLSATICKGLASQTEMK